MCLSDLSKSLLGLAFALVLAPTHAEGKDLQSRLGVGAYVQPGFAPALSVKYGFPADNKAKNLSLSAIIGGKFSPDGGNQTLGGLRFQSALVAEDHMNLFAAVTGLYVYNDDGSEDPLQGFDARATVGAEFFLFGLENLGLGIEGGGDILGDLKSDGTLGLRLGTTGSLFFHYYF